MKRIISLFCVGLLCILVSGCTQKSDVSLSDTGYVGTGAVGTGVADSPIVDGTACLNLPDRITTGANWKITWKQCDPRRNIVYFAHEEVLSGIIQDQFHAYYTPSGADSMNGVVVATFDTGNVTGLLKYSGPGFSDISEYCDPRKIEDIYQIVPKPWYQKKIDEVTEVIDKKLENGSELSSEDLAIDKMYPCGFMSTLKLISNNLVWTQQPDTGVQGYMIIGIEKE